jgi:hypothetical protein
MDAVSIHQPNIGGGNLAGERLDFFRLLEQQSSIEHIGDVELFDYLLVFDRDILLVLVKVEQFLPWGRQFLIGGNHRGQGADRELAFDDKVSADRIKEERGEISNETA